MQHGDGEEATRRRNQETTLTRFQSGSLKQLGGNTTRLIGPLRQKEIQYVEEDIKIDRQKHYCCSRTYYCCGSGDFLLPIVLLYAFPSRFLHFRLSIQNSRENNSGRTRTLLSSPFPSFRPSNRLHSNSTPRHISLSPSSSESSHYKVVSQSTLLTSERTLGSMKQQASIEKPSREETRLNSDAAIKVLLRTASR